MPERLRSRKFWVAVSGAIVLIANEGLGLDLDPNLVQWFAVLLSSYLLGQSFVDAQQ